MCIVSSSFEELFMGSWFYWRVEEEEDAFLFIMDGFFFLGF